jgi:hypothetical protein
MRKMSYKTGRRCLSVEVFLEVLGRCCMSLFMAQHSQQAMSCACISETPAAFSVREFSRLSFISSYSESAHVRLPPPRALNPFKSRPHHLPFSQHTINTSTSIPIPLSPRPLASSHPPQSTSATPHTASAAHNKRNTGRIHSVLEQARREPHPPDFFFVAGESRLEAVQLVEQPLCVVGRIVPDNFLRVAHIDLVDVLAKL